jgi:hypothetical protein
MKKRTALLALLVGLLWSLPPVPASADLVVNSPGLVLMIDGTDHSGGVATYNIDLTLPVPMYDFGFESGGVFTPIALAPNGPASLIGQYSFSGGSLVDFALRNNQTSAIYTIADPADYANQVYLGPIDPSHSVNPQVADSYYNTLAIQWDLNGNGFNPLQDAGLTLTYAVNPYDGMAPAPVPIPTSMLMFGSGLVGFVGMSWNRIVG